MLDLRRVSWNLSWNLFLTFLFILSTFFVSSVNGEILFEGFSKIILSGTHVGYIVQRYEQASKQFTSTYFVKTNISGGNISESLKAYSQENLKPIKYQYTRTDSEGTLLIDAHVSNEIMNMKITKNGVLNQKQIKLQEGVFFSTFLLYLMLKNPNGLKPGVKYNYKAVAEEDGNIYDGEAYISEEVAYQGQKVMKVLNTFKSARFISFVNSKGEVLATQSPVQNLSTELVPSPELATQNIAVPEKTLNILFGSIPQSKNSNFKKENIKPLTVKKTDNDMKKMKDDVAPAGRGIIIKGKQKTE